MPDKTYQPTIAGLRAFVALAQRRHFGSAAADLGVSQPSLSQALSALETGLGVTLVERTTRRVLLTQDGEELLPRAIAAVDAVDEFTAAAAGAGQPLHGAIRLGVIPTVAPYVLPAVLRGLAERLPDLRPRVVEEQTGRLVEQLRGGTLDVALLALPLDVPGIAEIPLYREDFVLALPAGHALAGKRRVDPSALADLPLLLLDEGHCLRDQALEVCALAGVRPDLGQTRAASLTTAVHCVVGGLGVTLIPQTAVASETASGDLAIATFASPRPGRRIGVVFRRSARHDDAYRQLATIIGEIVADTGAVTPV
ncbi:MULTISPECIES: hydrogen peroxide-inducible genes activator [Gordonia]|jgi:LysR family hydrogen peroxide-inducible transcriptional activator|uniref:Probable hydrogen peroxide-inducible genes activator n=2 Tax=Gordonia alkanivorans TaxID=84096 RepID=F9VXQ9_9ACTN|nr:MULTISPECIES: hydrogen peroxide-inducible genes activator [Gordonia]AZZ82026.1 hydrogen peroxide-inducible genes activator [Gordonia alkanivorans]ETA07879.1 hydrogen peroxide-inducible protein [Gordonia alkanivorans CGMCC 6845]MBA5848636.1 hydrogen peroxide-inducible genes activator [Gordonia amicalis]MDH3006458.1 hydrogen peroxide-inducible genes activator [Gordonia alkanivorans]MDH3009776.1 hydrogen peroxide-inducible genes activator [Gordonia alkanivorans]